MIKKLLVHIEKLRKSIASEISLFWAYLLVISHAIKVHFMMMVKIIEMTVNRRITAVR